MTRHDFDETLRHPDVAEMKTRESGRKYRGINPVSVIALTVSVVSPVTFLNWRFFPVPLIAVLLGGISLKKILDSPRELSGTAFSYAAVIISVCLGMSFAVWNYRTDMKSTPAGYVAVRFAEMQHNHQTQKLPEKIVALGKEKRKIYVQGYMYQGRQRSGLKDFILVRTVAHCKFCSARQNPTDMIDVHLSGGKTVSYRAGPVYVGGVLHVDETAMSRGELPYYIEADVIR
ncbi:MAG: hypothetical protein LBQ54_09565 [Planctomycetaceae bacterium]|jgi:hypothetical protein|nr:hypothetical protein [Planctomycetaceae bacterium]